MTPSLPVPTDNLYKFACLFGLVLVVTGVFSFVAVYASSLERKAALMEAIFTLEDKLEKPMVEQKRLFLNQTLLEKTANDESFANKLLGVVLGSGFLLAGWGWWNWKRVVHPRDERVAVLQVEKLELEVGRLRPSGGGTKGKPAMTAASSSET